MANKKQTAQSQSIEAPAPTAPNGDKEATKCKVSRKQFLDNAKPIEVRIGDRPYVASVKEFSTGSLGWSINDKYTTIIDGQEVKVQVGLNLTVVGSKELPKS